MLQTLANPVTNTPEKLAEVTTANFYQSIFNLAGFTGQSLSLDSKVSALCADKGWNCTDPAVHGMFGMWHFNSDQATCGYGCSATPTTPGGPSSRWAGATPTRSATASSGRGCRSTTSPAR